MSYQVSPQQAVESAGKLMKEGALREREARGRPGGRRARASHRARGHPGRRATSASRRRASTRSAASRSRAGERRAPRRCSPTPSPSSRPAPSRSCSRRSRRTSPTQVTARAVDPDDRHRRRRGLRRTGARLHRSARPRARTSAEVREALRQPRRRGGRRLQRLRRGGPRGNVPGRRPDVQAERGGSRCRQGRRSRIVLARSRGARTSSTPRSRSTSGTEPSFYGFSTIWRAARIIGRARPSILRGWSSLPRPRPPRRTRRGPHRLRRLTPGSRRRDRRVVERRERVRGRPRDDRRPLDALRRQRAHGSASARAPSRCSSCDSRSRIATRSGSPPRSAH